MPNLLPKGYEYEVITAEDVESEQPCGYKNGIAFDEESGDFILDGRNKIMDSDGIESWKSWCINCIQTERYKHLAYSTDFGIDHESVFAAASREEAESILISEITEALEADPYDRTDYVEEVSCSWPSPDTIEITVTIHGVDDVTIDITTYLTKES